MQKSLKCGIGLAAGLAITMASIQPAAAAESSPQPALVDSSTSEVIAASAEAAAALQSFGIQASDYPQISASDSAYFDQVATLALAEVDEPAAAQSAADTTCVSSKRAVYAAEIAAVNSARDANARSAAQETMYMYLSHYIDLSPSLVGTTCDYNSTDPRFSAWITNSDRAAYDQFLKTTNLTGAVSGFSDAITAAQVAQATPGIVRNLSKIKVSATTVLDAASWGISADYTRANVEQLIASHAAGDTPEQAILALEDGLSPDLPGTYGPAVVALAAAVLAPMVAAPLLGVGLAVLPVFVMLGTTIVNQAAWSGLLYSANSRVTGRMMRYLGM